MISNTSLTKLTLFLCIAWLGAGPINAQENEKDSTAWLAGYLMTEANYGHRHGKPHPTLTDFPHIIIGGTAQMGRGWSVVAELEYERFHSDGCWNNRFCDNYTTNKLYINKQWSEAANVKAGIIDVPVGTTNSGGPALTIYDPLDESTLMPMTWHEGGIAFWGADEALSLSGWRIYLPDCTTERHSASRTSAAWRHHTRGRSRLEPVLFLRQFQGRHGTTLQPKPRRVFAYLSRCF